MRVTGLPPRQTKLAALQLWPQGWERGNRNSTLAGLGQDGGRRRGRQRLGWAGLGLVRFDRMQWAWMGWDVMGWDRAGWGGVRWDGMKRDGMGWDGIGRSGADLGGVECASMGSRVLWGGARMGCNGGWLGGGVVPVRGQV